MADRRSRSKDKKIKNKRRSVSRNSSRQPYQELMCFQESNLSTTDLTTRVDKLSKEQLLEDIRTRAQMLSAKDKKLGELEDELGIKSEELKQTKMDLEDERKKREEAEKVNAQHETELQNIQHLPREIEKMLNSFSFNVKIEGKSKEVYLCIGECGDMKIDETSKVHVGNSNIVYPTCDENGIVSKVKTMIETFIQNFQANTERQSGELEKKDREDILDRLRTLESEQRLILSLKRSDKSVILDGVERLKILLRENSCLGEMPLETEVAIRKITKKFEKFGGVCMHLAEVLEMTVDGEEIDLNANLTESACRAILIRWLKMSPDVDMHNFIFKLEQIESTCQTKSNEIFANSLRGQQGLPIANSETVSLHIPDRIMEIGAACQSPDHNACPAGQDARLDAIHNHTIELVNMVHRIADNINK